MSKCWSRTEKQSLKTCIRLWPEQKSTFQTLRAISCYSSSCCNECSAYWERTRKPNRIRRQMSVMFPKEIHFCGWEPTWMEEPFSGTCSRTGRGREGRGKRMEKEESRGRERRFLKEQRTGPTEQESQTSWKIPGISVLRRLRQKDYHELVTNLGL